MKKLAVVLILVGVLSFYVVGSSIAQSYTRQLCVNGAMSLEVIATYVGYASGRYHYAVNGFGPGLVRGNAMISGNNIYWSLDLENPVRWVFTTDKTLNGTGTYYRLTGPENTGPLTICPGLCPPID